MHTQQEQEQQQRVRTHAGKKLSPTNLKRATFVLGLVASFRLQSAAQDSVMHLHSFAHILERERESKQRGNTQNRTNGRGLENKNTNNTNSTGET
jgi:hypothetical protein